MLAYRLGRSRATGVLTLYPAGTAPERLVLRKGQLMAAEVDALGRQAGRRLARLSSMQELRYTFEGGVAAYPPGAMWRQVSLAGWARTHIEAQLTANTAQTMAEQLAGARLALVPELTPDPSMCDATDLRIIDALRAPRRLEQLWTVARTSRYRLLAFLHFLLCVGAIKALGVAVPVPSRPSRQLARHLLGVSADSDRAALKRAYRRLARALHPDLHPTASAMRRRLLERKLAAVTAAYQQLTGSLPL